MHTKFQEESHKQNDTTSEQKQYYKTCVIDKTIGNLKSSKQKLAYMGKVRQTQQFIPYVRFFHPFDLHSFGCNSELDFSIKVLDVPPMTCHLVIIDVNIHI